LSAPALSTQVECVLSHGGPDKITDCRCWYFWNVTVTQSETCSDYGSSGLDWTVMVWLSLRLAQTMVAVVWTGQ